MRINDGGSSSRIRPATSQTAQRPEARNTSTPQTHSTFQADGMMRQARAPLSLDGTAPATTPGLTLPASDVRRGQTGPEVRQLQEALVARGYLSAADMATGPGTFGPKTEAALKAMQTASGLPATGVFDAATRAALARELSPPTSTPPGTPGVPPAGMQRGTEGAQVLQLQNTLAQLGYLTPQQVASGPGIFGPQTERAVKALQVRNGLPATGVYDAATQAAMQKEVAQYNDPASLVKDSYTRMLGREPTPQELAAATAQAEQIKQGGGSLTAMRQAVEGGIRQTDEYRAAHPLGSGAVSSVEDANNYFLTQWGGTPYNSASGAPYGYNDCGPTSTAMALASLGLLERPAPADAERTIDAVRDAALGTDTTYSQRMGFGPLQHAVEAYGGRTQMLNGGVSAIDEALARGNPVVIGGNPWQAWGAEQQAAGNYLNSRDPGGHFVTVLGKTPDGQYIIADPLVKNGAITVSAQQLETFFANGGFGAMEVYRP